VAETGGEDATRTAPVTEAGSGGYSRSVGLIDCDVQGETRPVAAAPGGRSRVTLLLVCEVEALHSPDTGQSELGVAGLRTLRTAGVRGTVS